jgi:hypothetical protein
LVRNRVTLAGLGTVEVEVEVVGGFRFSEGGILKLLGLPTEELVVEEDILWQAGGYGTICTWYQ